MLDPTQTTQWLSYQKEMAGVLSLFFIKFNKLITLNPIMENRFTIKLPFEKFFCSTTCSVNSYGHIINALNIVIPWFWICALVRVAERLTEC